MIHKRSRSDSTKTALVTGGARRIGEAIVRRLHASDYRVAIHHRKNAEYALALANALNRARPGSALTVGADLRSVPECRSLAADVLQGLGRLDAVVNNASAFYPTPLADATEADWETIAGSNMKGPFFLAQAAASALQETGGAVVNLVDIYADRPLADYSVYSAAKAGLVSLTRGLARELAPRVRVNAVAPGAILWPEQGGDESARQALLDNIPLARLGRREDVANAVHFLLSGEAGYITGQTLVVDGGRSVTSA